MAKRKVKQEIKEPDFVMRSFAAFTGFIRANYKACIIGLVVAIAVAAAAYAYAMHERRKDERAQELLFKGISSIQIYSVTGNEEELKKGEEILRKIVQERQGKIYPVAKLYLARVEIARGRKEEAKKLYSEILNSSPSTTLQILARRALEGMEEKR